MKKKAFSLFLVMFFSLVYINLVSAEISLSQLDPKYNIGDDFDITITVKEAIESNEFLRVTLICENENVELYKSPFQINSGETKNVTIKAKLDRTLISSSNGDCRIDASFGEETAESQSFVISDVIALEISLNSNTFDPSSEVLITGTAKKFNGEKINGFVTISLSGTNITHLSNIDSNTLNYSFTIPHNSPAGLYSLNVYVYERESSGAITNEGSFSEVIRVNQVVTELEISLSTQFVKPLENLTYTVILKDQSGAEVNTDVNTIIYTSKDKKEVFAKKTSKSFETVTIQLPKDALPGYWAIEGFYSSLTQERNFKVDTLSKASYSLNNDELVITNEGNVDYVSKIFVYIGSVQKEQEVSIPVNSNKSYKIEAPKGDYPVTISDSFGSEYDLGVLSIPQSTSSFPGLSFITGNAINLKDPDSRSEYIVLLVWILIVLVLLYVAFYFFKKGKSISIPKESGISNTHLARKTHTHRDDNPKPVKNINLPIQSSEVKDKPMEKKQIYESYTPNEDKSYSNGESKKEEVVVLALKIKNSSRLRQSESSALTSINNMLHKARQIKAKVYDQGDIKLLVFSQSLSNKINAVEAVKSAHHIDAEIKNFNKKYAIKIEYGMGMHVGEMYFEMIDSKPKFTSIGNITIVPKNIASRAKDELIISQELYRRVYAVVKSEQTDLGYRIVSFKDRSDQSPFIQKFMTRNKDQFPSSDKKAEKKTSKDKSTFQRY